jgi:hypothetical protein
MRWCVGIGALGLIAVATAADRAVARPQRPRADPAALAATIDRLIGDRLRAEHVTPAPPSDAAAFFRRVHLTLAGRIPVSSEVRAFLADTDPHKRAKAVDRLLDSAAYVNHMTTAWRGWLLPEAAANFDAANTAAAFEAWLRGRIRADVPYDRFVTEILTAPLNGQAMARRGRADDDDDSTNPLAFYTAKEGRPENLAAATSRVFLGVQLECAQCHDHPFARWSRDQFWGMAAFFGGVERSSGGGLREVFDRREMPIPNADRAVPATFLDDREPQWRFKQSPRATLAAWVTAPDNPFFAKAAVNRLWGFVFGVGLVDPVDDFHEKNLPSHPELLDALARAFVESGFDTRFILRAICLSETYQRSSAVTKARQADVRLYARFPVQGLTPEQLFDSLALATGALPEGGGSPLTMDSLRRQFLEAFVLSGRRTDAPTTIIQALTLMNGNLVGAATTLESSRTLAAIVDLPGLTPAERVEALYLVALGRPPRPAELSRAAAHEPADVLWALLNGIEFRTNH